MIGLFLIYFIGKSFYSLAQEHNKTKWGFAILGIVVYYLGTFIGGMIIGIIIELGTSKTVDDFSDAALGLMAFPLGLLSCWGFHFLLKRNWNKKTSFNNEEALDSELIQ